MPTMYDDVDALCPFFRESDKQKIKCDGLTDRCTTNLMFATKNDSLHKISVPFSFQMTHTFFHAILKKNTIKEETK